MTDQRFDEFEFPEADGSEPYTNPYPTPPPVSLPPTEPVCHVCMHPATTQWSRRATDDEWAAEVERCRTRAAHFGYEPDTFIPADGLALQAVFGCDEHSNG